MEERSVYKLSVKEKILFVLIQLFFISILVQYNDTVSGVIAGGLLLCCILYNSFNEKWQLVKERKHIMWMFLFFAWIFISLLMSKDRHEGFRLLDPRLPLFYFPLTIGLIRISRELKQRILLGIAVVTTMYCIACMIWGISNYIKTKNVDFLYNDWLTVLTGQQSIYISLLVNFSIYVYTWFIFYRNVKFKPLLVAGLLFLFGMSYMLASRNMILILVVSVLIFIVYYIFKNKKHLQGGALLSLLFLSLFLVFRFFPKTINRFKDILYTKFEYTSNASESHYTKETTPDQWNGANFRIAAWKCGWELFKVNPIAGTGLGDKKHELFEKYKEKGFHFAIQNKRNVHNNYLDILISAGIIGLALFLISWFIIPLRYSFLKKDYLTCFITLTFAMAMITEVYFDRSLGGLLFGFFIPFLFTDNAKQGSY